MLSCIREVAKDRQAVYIRNAKICVFALNGFVCGSW